MNRRAVAAVTLGLALVGCAQGRSAQPPAGFVGPYGPGDALPTIRESINSGLPPRAATAPGPAQGPGAGPDQEVGSGTPIVIPSLPPVGASINSGLPPADGRPAPIRPQQARPADSTRAAGVAGPAPTPIPGPSPLVMPPLPSRPEGATTGGPPGQQSGAGSARSPGQAPVDPAIRPAGEAEALRTSLDGGKIVGMTVATVDGEAITLAELVAGVDEYRDTYVPAGHNLSDADRNQIASMILQQLIDRTLVIQEARRVLLTSKPKEQMFQEHVDKIWREQEIPKLCRKHKLRNEYELREKLEADGQSLDMMREAFQKGSMAREFLQSRMQSRMLMSADPNKLRAYYAAHLDTFRQPAQVTWREIVVKVGPDEGRAEARRRADALLEQLRRGGDLAALARAHSQGPTAAKGGLWQTQPGASVVPAVNEALERLPLNQISRVMEGPHGYHIVRVEARRPAGPKPFEQVQHEIAETLQNEAFRKEMEGYIERLRERAVITSMFAGTQSAPAALRDDRARRASASSSP